MVSLFDAGAGRAGRLDRIRRECGVLDRSTRKEIIKG